MIFTDSSKDLLKSRKDGIVTITDDIDYIEILLAHTLLPNTIINITNEYTKQIIKVTVGVNMDLVICHPENVIRITTSEYDIILNQNVIHYVYNISNEIFTCDAVIVGKDKTIDKLGGTSGYHNYGAVNQFLNKIINDEYKMNNFTFHNIKDYIYKTIPGVTYYLLYSSSNYYDRIITINDINKMEEMIMVIKLFMNFLNCRKN